MNGRTEPRFGFQAQEVKVLDREGNQLFDGTDTLMNISRHGLAVLIGSAPAFLPVPGDGKEFKILFTSKCDRRTGVPVIPITLTASVQHSAKGWIGLHIETIDKINEKSLKQLLGYLACAHALPNPHWKDLLETIGVAANTIGVGFGIMALVFVDSQDVRVLFMKIMVVSVFIYVLLRLGRGWIEWKEVRDWP